MRKPFVYEELRARIAAVLRRGHSRHAGPVRVGEIVIVVNCWGIGYRLVEG